ncbi:MAG: glycosyltransferase, partial [Phaeobacter italicus]
MTGDASSQKALVGAVVIGRNEGQRLIDCLTSMRGQVARIVYVDSGSTDGSQDAATALGAEVVG